MILISLKLILLSIILRCLSHGLPTKRDWTQWIDFLFSYLICISNALFQERLGRHKVKDWLKMRRTMTSIKSAVERKEEGRRLTKLQRG